MRRRWLLVTTAFGICFLVLQAYFWRDLLLDRLAGPSTAYGTIFFSLTGLHAVHVLGGVSYLLLETVRASQHGDENAAAGTDFCAIYWHFMGLLWLTLFALLCYLG